MSYEVVWLLVLSVLVLSVVMLNSQRHRWSGIVVLVATTMVALVLLIAGRGTW
jgi:hypothetical protein